MEICGWCRPMENVVKEHIDQTKVASTILTRVGASSFTLWTSLLRFSPKLWRRFHERYLIEPISTKYTFHRCAWPSVLTMSFLLQQLVSSFKDRLDTHNSHKLSLSTFVILSAFSMHSMPHIQNVEQTNGIKTKANILSISVAKYWEQEVERCWIAAKKNQFSNFPK